MHLLLRLLERGLIMAGVLFFGTWVLRRLNPQQWKIAMVSIMTLLGLASVAMGFFDYRKNSSDVVPLLTYLGFGLLCFGIGIGFLFLKGRSRARSGQQ